MSFIDKVESVVKLPTVLQIVGVGVFALTVWKGVHGFFPTAGVICGAAMAYVGKHFSGIYQ